MKKLITTLMAMTAAFILAACTAADYVQGTKVSDETLASFTVGKTTKSEVMAALGGPNDIKMDGGKQILTYKYQKISGQAFGGKNESYDTILIFNANGVLEDKMKSNGGSMANPLTGK